MLGYRNSPLRSVYDLYDPIVSHDVPDVLACTKAGLQWVFQNPEVGQDTGYLQYSYRLRTKQGKFLRIMRQGTALRRVNNVLTHTLCTLTDISSIDDSKHVYAKAFGSRAFLFDARIPEISSFKGHLTSREIQILRLLARGKSSHEIGYLLSLSKHTVDTHRRNMIRKMDVSNSIELVNLCRDLNLL